MIGIYKITNKINGHCYIGQSVDINRRWQSHRKNYGIESNISLYQAFNKYGLDNFSFEIVEECSIEELNDKEKFYIEYFQSYINGYNMTKGGEGTPGGVVKITEKDLIEIYNLLINSKQTQREIAKLYEVGEDTISEINQGKTRVLSGYDFPLRKKESKELIIKHKIPSREELIKDIYNSSFASVAKKYGVSHTTIRRWCIRENLPTTKEQIVSLYKQENNIIKETKKTQSIPLKTLIYNKEGQFLSLENSREDAMLKYNLDRRNLNACLKGERKTVDGYIARNYKEDYPITIDVTKNWKQYFW